MTVNEALTLTSHVKYRLSDLQELRSEISKRKIWVDNTVREEVYYNPSEVEKEISRLKIWLLKADMAIKRSNARTELELDEKIEDLLKPMEGLSGRDS